MQFANQLWYIKVFVIYFSDRVITVLRLKPKANNDKCVLIGTLKYIDAKLIYGRHVTYLKRFKSFYYG